MPNRDEPDVRAHGSPPPGTDPVARLADEVARARAGGAQKYHDGLARQGKQFVRRRLEGLLDPGSLCEDGLLANCLDGALPADAVVTGTGRIGGRTVCFMASDATVKAGSWGARTVEKIVRIQETALRLEVPMLYLVDSAGGRITDQVAMFPGRRHAGRIFALQVRMSGVVPQVCLLFGPSPAGAAYVPALSDAVIMVEGNAGAYLGSPRMAEAAIGERVSHEEMGGARLHCTASGLGDFLAPDEQGALALLVRYLDCMPQNWRQTPADRPAAPPAPGRLPSEIVPSDPNVPFDMHELIRALVDDDSFLEVKALYAREVITGFARLDGRLAGIVANQPRVKGGVLFVDSADKAARFVWLCNAYGVPLVFLADVPGFMIGSQVERQGIIRHGAKMICAVAEATVPKISVIVRKSFGAGLYAMAGPAFDPDCCLALPTAQIAIMGPEAAINAVYYHKIMEQPAAERDAYVRQLRDDYARDIDIFRLASELIVDAVVDPDELRAELIRRLGHYGGRPRPPFAARVNPVYPV